MLMIYMRKNLVSIASGGSTFCTVAVSSSCQGTGRRTCEVFVVNAKNTHNASTPETFT